jgi:hypothetical protein
MLNTYELILAKEKLLVAQASNLGPFAKKHKVKKPVVSFETDNKTEEKDEEMKEELKSVMIEAVDYSLIPTDDEVFKMNHKNEKDTPFYPLQDGPSNIITADDLLVSLHKYGQPKGGGRFSHALGNCRYHMRHQIHSNTYPKSDSKEEESKDH